MNLLFLGPPGSGKGTQSGMLSRELGLAHLSTGDILREAVKEGTDLGNKAKSYMDEGNLVPDELIVDLIKEQITSGQMSKGFILDGFPRTVPQAESLKVMLDESNIALDKALLFDVPDDELVNRISGRYTCPECNTGYNYPMQVPKKAGYCDFDGATLTRRPDDEVDVVRNRLNVYKEQTAPLIDFYRNESILTEIDANIPPDELYNKILGIVN